VTPWYKYSNTPESMRLEIYLQKNSAAIEILHELIPKICFFFTETVCGERFYQNFKLDTPFVTFVDLDRTRRPHEDKVEGA
jgi:hypothetical protein